MKISFDPTDAGIVPSAKSQAATYNGKLRSSRIEVNGTAVDPDGKSGWATLALTLAQRSAFDQLFNSPAGLAALSAGVIELPDANSGRKAAVPTVTVAAQVAALQAAAEAAAQAAAEAAQATADGPAAEAAKSRRTARRNAQASQ